MKRSEASKPTKKWRSMSPSCCRCRQSFVAGFRRDSSVCKEAATMKKYELLADDCLRAGDRTVYRIRALRDFGDVRRGDIGGYGEGEAKLSHGGDSWVYDAAQIYGENGVVRGNGKARGCAWV